MNENIEFDVLRLLLTLKKHLPIIIAAALIGALLMFAYTYFFSTPVYRSEAMVYISNKISYDTSSDAPNLTDINSSELLVPVFSELVRTNAVLERVVAASDLPYTASQLSRLVAAAQIEDTAVLRIVAIAPDAEQCADIANSVATTGITEITKIAPGSSAYLIDQAEAPAGPYAPSFPKRVMMGFLAGAVIAAGFAVLREILDTKVHSEEELAKLINAPILGVIGNQSAQI